MHKTCMDHEPAKRPELARIGNCRNGREPTTDAMGRLRLLKLEWGCLHLSVHKRLWAARGSRLAEQEVRLRSPRVLDAGLGWTDEPRPLDEARARK